MIIILEHCASPSFHRTHVLYFLLFSSTPAINRPEWQRDVKSALHGSVAQRVAKKKNTVPRLLSSAWPSDGPHLTAKGQADQPAGLQVVV
jgi:hypothetical protein